MRGIWEALEQGKGRGKWCNYNSKIKEIFLKSCNENYAVTLDKKGSWAGCQKLVPPKAASTHHFPLLGGHKHLGKGRLTSYLFPLTELIRNEKPEVSQPPFLASLAIIMNKLCFATMKELIIAFVHKVNALTWTTFYFHFYYLMYIWLIDKNSMLTTHLLKNFIPWYDLKGVVVQKEKILLTINLI